MINIIDSPAQKVLDKLLKNLDDPRVTRKVSNRLFYARDQIKKLKKYVKAQDEDFFLHLLNQMREYNTARIEILKDQIPEEIYRYAMNVMSTLFKLEIREIKDRRRAVIVANRKARIKTKKLLKREAGNADQTVHERDDRTPDAQGAEARPPGGVG